jgi:signal transduction histidine kinase
VEAGAYELDLRPVEIAALMGTLAKRFRQQFDSKGIALDLDLPAALPPVLADEHRLLQVLSNLTANALMYIPQAGPSRSALRVQMGTYGSRSTIQARALRRSTCRTCSTASTALTNPARGQAAAAAASA